MPAQPLSRRLVLAGGCALVLAPPALAQTIGADDRMIVPGVRIGAVRKGSTWASLAAVYKAENMKRGGAPDESGDPTPGARIFPGRADMLELQFTSDDGPVVEAAIAGDGSAWRTANGIRIGTTLAALEKLNGGPFTIAGFGWDGGGEVKAARNLPRALGIRLSPRQAEKVSPREYDQVTGDKTVSTAHPVMKKIDVAVNILTMQFPA